MALRHEKDRRLLAEEVRAFDAWSWIEEFHRAMNGKRPPLEIELAPQVACAGIGVIVYRLEI
jgi:hypothetical protein